MTELEMHYEGCWNGRAHHDCAVRKIKHMQGELADACAARDALARECNYLENAVEHNAQLVEERDAKLAQAREELAQARAELKDLQGANRECGRQLEAMRESREYWYEKALVAEAERDEARGNLERMVELNKWSLNELDRVGKQAERTEALAATLAEVYAMLNCSPEHPWSRCEAQEYSNEDHYMCHSQEARELLEKALEGGAPTNAQALAALVTEETAALLEKLLTWDILLLRDERDSARKLIAQIREALEENE